MRAERVSRPENRGTAHLYRGIRLFTAAFLLIILTLVPDVLNQRPDPRQLTIEALGLVVFCACYVRVVYRSIPSSRRIRAPWTLGGVIASGLVLMTVLPAAWIYYLPFYVLTCLVLSQSMWPAMLSGVVVLVVMMLIAFERDVAPLRLSVLAVQLLIFTAVLAGVHQVMEFALNQREAHDASLRAAAEAARLRLSRDLHDVLGRDLIALALRAEAAAAAHGTRNDAVLEELRHLAALARTTLNNVRAVVEDLRAPDLAAELNDSRELLARAGIDLLVLGGPGQAHRSAAFAWFLREAVTNVVKHSDASICRIVFGDADLTVEDDGRPVWPLVPGAGLTGLRERLAEAGAELVVARSAEGGVRLTATLGPPRS